MKAIREVTKALMLVGMMLAAGLTLPGQSETKWGFDGDAEGKPPAGFTLARTGNGSDGQWVIKNDDTAPSKPHVLAQVSSDSTDYRFPLAIAGSGSYKDFILRVKFKAISGKVDQGAGLVFRLQDKDNYYVVRANALEDNYRLYHVVGGRRVQFAGANFKVTPNAWHEMRVEARGERFECFFDGQLKITAQDGTFKEAGKVGVWTKADSVIYFDDLAVQGVGASAGATNPPKILAQRLAEDVASKNADLVRIGLHLTPPKQTENIIIASNVAAKIGRKSDPEDLQALKTGRPVVLKEGDNFDVTLPLHDISGKLIGAVGITLKPKPGDKEADVLRRAKAIASDLEKQIASKDKLFL